MGGRNRRKKNITRVKRVRSKMLKKKKTNFFNNLELEGGGGGGFGGGGEVVEVGIGEGLEKGFFFENIESEILLFRKFT